MASVVPADALPDNLKPKRQELNVVPLDALPENLRTAPQQESNVVPMDALPEALRPTLQEPVEKPLTAKQQVEQAFKGMGTLGRIGFETDTDEAIKKRLMGAPSVTTGVEPLSVYQKRRQVAEETVNRANAAVEQARAQGLPEEEVNKIYNQALGPGVATVSTAPDEWTKPEEYLTPAREDKTGLESTLEAAQATASALGRGAAKGYYGLAEAGGGELRFFKDMLGIAPGGVEETLDSIRQKSAAIGESESHPLQLIEGVANSIVQSAPMTAALMSGVGTTAALTGLWVQSFGQTYDESRSLGLSEGESVARGALYGTAEALGEQFGLPFTAKFLRNATKGMNVDDAGAFIANLIAKEIPGEQLTYFLEFGTDKGFGLNPEAGIKEYLKGAVDTALITTLQGGGMYGGAKMVSSIAQKLNERKDREAPPAPGDLVQPDTTPLAAAQQINTTISPIATDPVITPTNREERVAQLTQFGISEEDANKIIDKELGTEAADVGRTDTSAARESTGIPGGPVETGATPGTTDVVGPGVVGAGDTTGAAPSGAPEQPSALAPIDLPVDTETTIAWSTPGTNKVQTSTGKVVEVEGEKFVQVEAGQDDTGNAIFDFVPLAQENVIVNPTPDQVSELEAKAQTEFDKEQKAETITETAPAVDPFQVQAKQLANEIFKLDREHQLIPVLRDELVNIDDINFAKQELARLQEERGKPQVIPGETTSSVQEVRQVLSEILSGPKAKNAVVVDTYDELPTGLREQAIASDAKSFVDPATGTDYYVASAIPKGEIKGTLLHERGTHIGLTNLIGEERVTALANRVVNWIGTGKGIETTIANEAVAAADASGEERGSARYNQEVIAYFTELAVNKYGIDPTQNQPLQKQKVKAWLRDLWNSVYEALKKLNINTNTLTAKDVVNIVYAAARVPTGKLADEVSGGVTKEKAEQFDQLLSETGFLQTDVEPATEEKISPAIQASRRRAPDKSLIKTELAKQGTDVNALAPPLRKANLKLRAIASVAPRLTRKIIAYDTSTDFNVDMLTRAGVPHMNEVNSAMRSMSLMRAKILSAATDIARRWEAFSSSNPEASTLLDQIIGYSTLEDIVLDKYPDVATALGSDAQLLDLQAKEASAPTMRVQAAYKGQVRQRADRIRTAYDLWSRLGQMKDGAEGQKLYALVRQYYKAMFQLRRSIQDELLTASNIPGDVNNPSTPKGKVMAAINKELDSSGSLEAYFPLGRNGDFWLQFGKGPLKEVYRFESEVTRAEFLAKRIEELQAAGDPRTWEQHMEDGDATIGNDIDGLRPTMSDSSDMLKKAIAIIDKHGGTKNAQELKDAIYQLWLETLPERSFRKAYIKRQYGGVAGFSADMRREFVKASYGYANQLSRLRYGPKIVRALESARSAIAGDAKMFDIMPYLDEVEMRMREVLRPKVEDSWIVRATNGATQLGFLYALSGVASALTNFFSIPMYGYWTGARYYGTKETSVAMTHYMNIFSQLTGSMKFAKAVKAGKATRLSVGELARVKANPVLAAGFKALVATEVTETTGTFELLAMAKNPSREYAGAVRRGMRNAVSVLGFMFHHSERLMREAQAMAYFELAYNKAVADGMAPGVNGEAFNHAVNMAFNLTKKSMMNYETVNRPRILRGTGVLGPIGPIAGLFKMFPSQVLEYHITATMDVLSKTSSKEQRYGAALQLLGGLMTGFLLGGLSGLWEWEDVLDIIQMVMNRFTDDKTPIAKRDLRVWYRNALVELFGPDWAQIIDKGAISAVTNVDISSRLGVNFGFFHDATPGATIWEDLQNTLFQMGGPVLSLGKGATDGVQDITNGFYYEGMEKAMPRMFSNPVAAARWADEGVKSQYTRKTIIPEEAISTGDVVWKALGFSRTDLDMIRDRNYRLQNIDKKIVNKRNRLLDRVFQAVERGGGEAVTEAFKDIAEFNKNYPSPTYRIESDDVSRSLRTRYKQLGMSYQGFPMTKDIYLQNIKLFHQVPTKGFKEPMSSEAQDFNEPEEEETPEE